MNELNNDYEVLSVNNELIQNEKLNGFSIQKSDFWMTIKKIPSNVYKLCIIVVAALSEYASDFLAKVPVLGYAVDLVAAYGKNLVSQVASDEFFDNVICPLIGLEVNFSSPAYCSAFVEFTHHEGKYFQVSMLIKTIATFMMEHPGLVLAGGAIIVGLLVKLITKMIKGLNNSIKYNDMNNEQKEVYQLLKEVLKKSRKIKKGNNGEILVDDLNITYEIIDNLRDYPDMLARIKTILSSLKTAIENNNIDDFEKYRLALERNVLMFEQEHDKLLNKKMHLVQNILTN